MSEYNLRDQLDLSERDRYTLIKEARKEVLRGVWERRKIIHNRYKQKVEKHEKQNHILNSK